jgi:UDP-hydrolysing UDP-N-acetyl-D-glucosamine 2-epimerase
MKPVLRAIRRHPKLQLQIIVTGMHLDRSRGYSLDQIKSEGWLDDIEHVLLPWRPVGTEPSTIATATGRAIASVSGSLKVFRTDIVLVCGDRVEAFAGASAGHISGRVVAHVHGGDRALGQVDDSLRHAVTKLSHVHLAATTDSAKRIARLGEDKWRIHVIGAPGIDGITDDALALTEMNVPVQRRRYALLVLHPTDADAAAEQRRAQLVLNAVLRVDVPKIVIVHPNNDPGADGIVRCWNQLKKTDRVVICRNLPRNAFLGLLKDAAALVGNSSAGIIEAASFGTPVLDIGDRQKGRLRSQNVANAQFHQPSISGWLDVIWNSGRPLRYPKRNVYGGAGAGKRIASVLAKVPLDARMVRKLIAY